MGAGGFKGGDGRDESRARAGALKMVAPFGANGSRALEWGGGWGCIPNREQRKPAPTPRQEIYY